MTVSFFSRQFPKDKKMHERIIGCKHDSSVLTNDQNILEGFMGGTTAHVS